MCSLLPNAVILNDMDYFIRKVSPFNLTSQLPGHRPEFVFNLVINFSMVLSQTLGVRLVLRMSYFKKFQVALLPLIAVIVALPMVIQWLEEEAAWVTANAMLGVVGIQLLC